MTSPKSWQARYSSPDAEHITAIGTAGIRALSADHAYSLRVIRFQAGLLLARRSILRHPDLQEHTWRAPPNTSTSRFVSVLGQDKVRAERLETEARLADDLAVLITERFTSYAASPPMLRVPRPPSEFVGRWSQLSELVELITSDGVRLVTLTGLTSDMQKSGPRRESERRPARWSAPDLGRYLGLVFREENGRCGLLSSVPG